MKSRFFEYSREEKIRFVVAIRVEGGTFVGMESMRQKKWNVKL